IYDSSPVGPAKGRLSATMSAPNAQLSVPCNIPGTSTDGNRAIKYFYYSPGGEIQDVFECADGLTFQTSYEYDSAGRQSRISYPTVKGTRFSVVDHYTSTGFLQYIADGTDGSVIWKATSRNAAGHVTDETLGNG